MSRTDICKFLELCRPNCSMRCLKNHFTFGKWYLFLLKSRDEVISSWRGWIEQFSSWWCKQVSSNLPLILALWQFGLSSFQGRDTKLDRFLAKNHHTQWQLLYFVNIHSAELSKSAKSWLSKSIFSVKTQKQSEFFWVFRRVQFLTLRGCVFWQNTLISYEYCWFLAKNLAYIVFLPWKVDNPNCHTWHLHKNLVEFQ